jgi:hypothetical protein
MTLGNMRELGACLLVAIAANLTGSLGGSISQRPMLALNEPL